MDIPKLMAHLVVVASEGLTGQDALDRLAELADDKPQKPQLRFSKATDYDAYHSQQKHNAYVAWIRQPDDD